MLGARGKKGWVREMREVSRHSGCARASWLPGIASPICLLWPCPCSGGRTAATVDSPVAPVQMSSVIYGRDRPSTSSWAAPDGAIAVSSVPQLPVHQRNLDTCAIAVVVPNMLPTTMLLVLSISLRREISNRIFARDSTKNPGLASGPPCFGLRGKLECLQAPRQGWPLTPTPDFTAAVGVVV
jgi:hypothetical protein